MLRLMIVLVCLAAATARAGAQTEYRLGPDGQWVLQSSPQPGTDAAFISDARTLLAQKKYSEARRILTRWIDEHKFTENPWLPEAYLLRGDARQGTGDEYLALYDYKKITKDYSATAVFITAIERELAIGISYLNGKLRKFLGIRWYNAETDAVELLTRIQEQVPGSVLAERAGFELIRYYYRERQLAMASEMSMIFMVNFPRSKYRALVLEYRIKSNWGLYAGPEYDGSYLIEARQLILQYMAEFPADAERTGIDEAALARIDESEAEQMYRIARWYMGQGDPASARYTLRRLVQAHPLTVAAGRAYEMLVDKGWSVGIEPPGEAAAERKPEAAPAGGGK